MSSRSANVAGVGIASPAGSTVDAAWETVVSAAGTRAAVVTSEPLGDTRVLACRAEGFDPASRLARHELRRLDRTHQLAIWAADDAVAEAGGGPAPERCAVVVGVAFGAAEFSEQQYRAFVEGGYRAISPVALPVIMPNSVAAHLSIRYGFRGPALTLSTACASGSDAIGEALWLLRSGRADRVLCGGVDALLTPYALGGFARMEAMSRRFDEPAHSSRPFTASRDGLVIGEGAGFLVLERGSPAGAARGTIRGHAATSDAHHIVAPREDGLAATACIRAALADAGVEPEQVGHVNAHGTSTPRNDRAEAHAIAQVFGAHVPVTASKAVFGHLMGAAGAVEAIIALEAVRRGVVPPTANHAGDSDPDIDELITVTDVPTSGRPEIAVSNSFGFGGHNAVVVVGR